MTDICYRTIADWQAVYAIDPIRARNDLHRAIKHDFKIHFPRRVFTPGNSSPFDFLAYAFFHQDANVAAWACRSGGKTLGSAILATLEYAYYDVPLQGRVLAGSSDQGKNLYKYWSNFAVRVLKGRELKLQKLLSRVDKGQFEILTASEASCRGPKIPRLFEDEIDEIDPELDGTAKGMIATTDGVPGRTIYTSTWHKTDGTMAKLVSKSPGNGVIVFRWNIWEAISKCDPKRHKEGKGCQACALKPACVTKAQEFHNEPNRTLGIAAECEGLYKVPDVIQSYQAVSKRKWDAEWMCLRPSIEGCVYPEFDPLVHAKATAPTDLRIYQAIDWGYNVFVCLWVGVTKSGAIYVLDTYRAEEGTLKGHADYIKDHKLFPKVRATYCDPAGTQRNDQTGRTNIALFRKWGIRCTFTRNKKLCCVRNGIQMIRDALEPADVSMPPRLYYIENENNQAFSHSMQSYHNKKQNNRWVDDPQLNQEFDHIPAAIRYLFVNLGRSGGATRVQLGVR